MGNQFRVPSFAEERLLASQGYSYIAGIDEVGRGALAGPVVAAAVILPRDLDTPWLDMVQDSKLLSPQRRRFLFHHIHLEATAIGIGACDCRVIDARGIVPATRLAMKLAVQQLSPAPESLLIDYLLLPDISLPQKGIKFGDSLSFSIACASIIAKVARDTIMIRMDKEYSGYGLARHKGYGTPEHLARLTRLGPSSIHRRSFRPVRELL